MDINDIFACINLGAKTVQIGTYGLLNGIGMEKNKGIKTLLKEYKKYNDKNQSDKFYSPEYQGRKKNFANLYAKVNPDICERCGDCLRSFYCDAFQNRSYKNKRLEFLKEFKTNSETKITIPPKNMVPIIVEDLCLGCGLCAQLCSKNAITLHERKDKEN